MTSTTTVEAQGLAPLAPGSFLLGSAADLRRDMLATYERAFERYGDVVRFRAGPPGARIELHLVSHPDGAHRVLAAGGTLSHEAFQAAVAREFGPAPAQHPQLDCAPAARGRPLLQPLGSGALPSATAPGAALSGDGRGLASLDTASLVGLLNQVAGILQSRG